jgi:hypothetical protein
MTRTEELLKLAEAATPGPHRIGVPQPIVDLADREFQRVCTPETIRQLVELVRLQHEALKHWGEFTYEAAFSTSEAIEAFNKWEGK